MRKQNIYNKKELEDYEEKYLASYALKSKQAERNRHEPSPLEYRTQFHRDRDRIIWSRSFKRLQHKTQIFPCYSADHFRRRLTHSLEVSQIATTIARSLELNEVATEAMALAHDIGHAPFGHSGEKALNEKLTELKEKNNLLENKNVIIYNFDHALQGVEIVERIEKEYEPKYSGLNLTVPVIEGILKHRRRNLKEPSPIKEKLTYKEIVNKDKYTKYGLDYGSLEAQCVFFADKLAYFFADFEDALRSHILNYSEINKGSFKQFIEMINGIADAHQYPKVEKNIDNIDLFLEFRRKAISALILNVIEASYNLISSYKLSSPIEAKKLKKRMIKLDAKYEKIKDVTYDDYIKQRVFNHELYRATEFKAETIIKDLFDAYYQDRKLIPADYNDHIINAYRGLNLNEKEINILSVKNYIAGMTDSFIISRHKDLFMSSENILII
ncbi:MAG: dNTP triphosphohydrolase [Acidobacteriota bacterium]|nr:dNTP triphosphohydrolase [Acidobacteriota bacterium]